MKIAEYTNREKNLIQIYRSNARRMTQQCYNPGCTNNAIRSHVQQKGGPLKQIASNGTVISLQYAGLFVETNYLFQEQSIANTKNDALTFWGFCNTCDIAIFSPIEVESWDFEDYSNQLRYLYRTLVHELFKKEYNMKAFTSVINDTEIRKEIKNKYTRFNLMEMIGSKVLRYCKSLCENDLSKGTRSFEFIHFKLPRALEISATISFGRPTRYNLSVEEIEKIRQMDKLQPRNNVYALMLIPTKDSTVCIIGQIADKNLIRSVNFNKILKYSIQDKLKFINDVLIMYGETWCMSVRFFETLKKT